MEEHIEFGRLAFNLFLVLLLVLLNGVFVAAEFSLVKVRHSRLTQLESEGNRFAPYALKVANRLDAYLSATQLGITLTSLGLGWLGEPAVSELLVQPLMYQLGFSDPTLITGISVALGFAIITFLHIVLGELAPKSLAIQKSEGTSLALAGPLLVFYYVFLPVIWLLNHAANAFLRIFGIQPAGEGDVAHSEEEIRILMNQSAKSGAIDLEEVKLMDNIFDFSDMLAREVMLPRTDMDCLYVNLPLKENMKIIRETRHSRYPVAIEDKDQIIGFVHITDVLLWPQGTEPNLRKLVRPILNVPESMEISHVLRLMQQKRAQLTLVVDEYGGTAGLLTAEEILEEIVGDLYDEFENERPEVEVIGDVVSVEGRLLIEDVNDLTGAGIDDEEVDSIGGWMFKELEGNPLPGQIVEFGRFRFEVAEAERLRITRVHIHKPHEESEEDEENGTNKDENEQSDE